MLNKSQSYNSMSQRIALVVYLKMTFGRLSIQVQKQKQQGFLFLFFFSLISYFNYLVDANFDFATTNTYILHLFKILM